MYERNKDIYSRNGVKRVVIIGSGNVAEALAKAIGASRYELVQIYARNRERGQAIARAVRCACADDPKRIAEADVYLMAVSDRAVPKLSESFDFGDAVVAHTAGSVALGELAPRIRNKGVFYPLQTFTAGRSLELSDVPLFIEGNNDFTVDALAGLAGALSTRVRIADSRQRMQLHRAAVVAGVRPARRPDQAADPGNGRQGARQPVGCGRTDRSCAPQRLPYPAQAHRNAAQSSRTTKPL